MGLYSVARAKGIAPWCKVRIKLVVERYRYHVLIYLCWRSGKRILKGSAIRCRCRCTCRYLTGSFRLKKVLLLMLQVHVILRVVGGERHIPGWFVPSLI